MSALDVIKYITDKIPEGAKIVPLSPEDVRFMSTLSETEPDRIKHLGDFEVEIQLKGSPEPVKRTIRVLPET